MDHLQSDPDGDQLIASLVFDEETGLPLSHRSHLAGTDDLPSFMTPTRTQFPGFPYPTPYPQQIELMCFLYNSLASAKCCIIESPTGTGKSLTLLTSSLHWLLDHNKALDAHLANLREYLKQEGIQSVESADWIAQQCRRRALRIRANREIEGLEATQKALVEVSQLMERGQKAKALFESSTIVKPSVTSGRDHPSSSSPEVFGDRVPSEDDSFLPRADTEVVKGTSEPDPSESGGKCRVLQVIYCSRTHSQLAQVVEELNKLEGLLEHITVVTLASRQLLCVNKSVYGLKSQAPIRDACLDLAARRPGCKFQCRSKTDVLSDYLVGARVSAVEAAAKFRKTLDIEELPALACPYYANKRGLPSAQLVLAPYQTVVVPASRDAAGLCLHNNVLIFDEAHNLLEAVAEAFSATVSHTDLLSTERLVAAFLGHYHARLLATSALRLRQLALVVKAFANLLEGKAARSGALSVRRRQRGNNDVPDPSGQTVYTLGDFLFAAGLDHINLSYLVDYLRSDRRVHMIAGFGRWFSDRKAITKGRSEPGESGRAKKRTGTGLTLSECLKRMKRPPACVESSETPPVHPRPDGNRQDAVETSSASTSVAAPPTPGGLQSAGTSIFTVLGFLEALVKSDREGDGDGRILVTPLATASSASVTCNSTSASIRFFILNPGRYLHDAVKQARSVVLVGGTLRPFEEFIEQVFHPAGKLDTDISIFSCGHVINVKRQLAIYTLSVSPNNITWDFTFKAMFREPRTATALAEVMHAYAAAATASNKRGACITCVIGGKLSEGINFNDDLARGVVIVGLPYPNTQSALMREKLSFLEKRFGGPGSGQRFCEAACMRAVNQAIGRAVRHVGDYAVIFLMDQRFATSRRLRSLLPSWTRDALVRLPATAPPSSPLCHLRHQLHDFFHALTATER